MKKTLITLFSIICTISMANDASELAASISYFKFKDRTELYFSIDGNSLLPVKNEFNKFQGAVNAKITVSKGDSVFFYDYIKIKSPEVASPEEPFPVFLHPVVMPLAQGKNYLMELEIDDANIPDDKPVTIEQTLTLKFDNSKVNASDLMLLESITPAANPGPFTKGNYDLVPLVSSGAYYFPPSLNELNLYLETYFPEDQVASGEKVLTRYYIRTLESKKLVKGFGGQKVSKAQAASTLIVPMKIGQLPSGNYEVIVEMVNGKNEMLIQRGIFFQRNNPIQVMDEAKAMTMDLDQTFVGNIDSAKLVQYIDYLYPLFTSSEQRRADMLIGTNKIKTGSQDLKGMQSFFYTFWLNRSPNEPLAAWEKYHDAVKLANKEFSNNLYQGYRTDRGRVFLKYGRPNAVQVSENEPSSYPYQIWQYYSYENQTNIMFVFVNKQLGSNDYLLIHSTAIGELYDDRWRMQVVGRTHPTNDIERTSPIDFFGTDLDNTEFIDRKRD